MVVSLEAPGPAALGHVGLVCGGLKCWLVKLCYVSISEKPVSPKSGALKSPPKGLDTTAINKSYYNVVSDCTTCLRNNVGFFGCL